MYSLPVADTSDFSEGVNITLIGLVDIPPSIITITSTNPDDSVPMNCSDVKLITNTIYKTMNICNKCFLSYC